MIDISTVHVLGIWDWLLLPVYLLIIIQLGQRWRNRHFPVGHPLRKYYMYGLLAKIAGSLFVTCIYSYYYEGGDIYNYLYHAKVINSSLSDSFETWFHLMMRASPSEHPEIYPYTSQMFWYTDASTYTISRITAIIGLFNNTSAIPIALVFAYISYSGIWRMYTTFLRVYPTMTRQLAIAFLFIPSTLVWGSSIFKDTVCMFGLGWMVYTTFRLFVNRDFSAQNIFMLALSFFLIFQIKLYILLAFIPALNLWLLLTYASKIKMASLRWMVNIAFVGLTIGGFMFLSGKFAKEMNQYSLEKIASTAQATQAWTQKVAINEGGSAYNLGAIDGTLGGMISKFPQAVVVTLFRPFPWEVSKVIVALSALESFLFLYFTVRIFFRPRSRPLRKLRRDPNLVFFLVFALIFAFAVGISSGNFGALSRYKIPCLPFYAALLMVLAERGKEPEAAAEVNPVDADHPELQPAI